MQIENDELVSRLYYYQTPPTMKFTFRWEYAFIIIKVGLYVAFFVFIFSQLTAITSFQKSLELPNPCDATQAICLSNMRDLLRLSRSAAWLIESSIIAAYIGLLLECLSLFVLVCTKETDISENTPLVILVITAFGFNGIVFLLTLSSNSCLWNAALQYTAQIHTSVITSLRMTVYNGIPGLIVSVVNGCPCAAALIGFLCQ